VLDGAAKVNEANKYAVVNKLTRSAFMLYPNFYFIKSLLFSTR